MLSLLVTNIGPLFYTEGSQTLVQICHHGQKKLTGKGGRVDYGAPFKGEEGRPTFLGRK
jgi:hypothetical protein